VAASWNDQLAKEVMDWFKTLNTISGINDDGYISFSMKRINEKRYKEQAVDFLKAADLGIEDIQLKMLPVEELPHELPDKLKEFIKSSLKEAGEDQLLSGLST